MTYPHPPMGIRKPTQTWRRMGIRSNGLLCLLFFTPMKRFHASSVKAKWRDGSYLSLLQKQREDTARTPTGEHTEEAMDEDTARGAQLKNTARWEMNTYRHNMHVTKPRENLKDAQAT